MSNDVHLAKVSKIHRNVTTKGAITSRSNFRLNNKGGGGEVIDDIRPSTDEEYLFGSISPRGGGCITMSQHFSGGDLLDSPDHTQRDTTESDNNISSCSTLDIVNKVSGGRNDTDGQN